MNRYLNIMATQIHFSFKELLFCLTLIWGLPATVLSVLLFLMSPSSLATLNGMCLFNLHTDSSILVWLFAATNNAIIIISIPLIAVCYIKIIIKMHESQQTVASYGQKSKSSQFTAMGLLIGSNILCWIPVTVVSLLRMAEVHLPPQVPSIVAGLLMPFNAIANPILYTIKTSTFSSDFTTLLFKHRK